MGLAHHETRNELARSKIRYNCDSGYYTSKDTSNTSKETSDTFKEALSTVIVGIVTVPGWSVTVTVCMRPRSLWYDSKRASGECSLMYFQFWRTICQDSHGKTHNPSQFTLTVLIFTQGEVRTYGCR